MYRKLLIASLALALPATISAADADCPTSNGGRKIAIVVDSSGSNVDTDPSDLRIVAAKNLNGLLVPNSDQVTVIDFDSYAAVIYPLGDPASASFDGINSIGGTNIASGVESAIDELTKNQGDPTAGRSGIVVFTDGEDSSIAALLTQLEKAKQEGIRVSFGFLSPQSPADASDLLAAILDTGGIYSTITSDTAQAAFVDLVVRHGLTANDNGGDTGILYPGLAVAANVSSTSARTFTYSSQAGEKLNFTVDALSGQSLDVKLQTKDSSEINKTSTDQTGHAEILYTPSQAVDLVLEVSTSNSTTGLFTVGFNSSAASNRTNACKPKFNGGNK